MNYWQDKHRTLYNGNCRNMSELADESVQMVVTSPPYWGLRKYAGEQESVWGGTPECEHSWIDSSLPKSGGVGDYEVGRVGNAAAIADCHDKKESNTCSLCGAWRGAYGLEPTPQLYVEHTVEILREIRRVLRSDGVVFWNIDDSYFGGGHGYGSPVTGKQATNAGTTDDDLRELHYKIQNKRNETIKAKDLCLIPFRVAQALQEPYFTGKIKDEKDRVWLAAMIDGEGCLFIHKRGAGQDSGDGYLRKNDTYGAGLEVANTDQSIVNRCFDITHVGSITCSTRGRNQPLYRWHVKTNNCKDIIKEIYPYLVAKKQQARILYNCPPSGKGCDDAHKALIGLHHGVKTDIDYPEPPTCYEPGWYVRSVIIWAKPNPMPESVTDRPTGSHEYILMLTKSAKYYWDMEAVREPHQTEPGPLRDKANEGYGEAYLTPIGSGLRTGYSENGRNIRDVWTFPTQPYPNAHFATYPEKLPELCIKAATPEVGCCSKCGKAWERITETTGRRGVSFLDHSKDNEQGLSRSQTAPMTETKTLGWQPGCECNAEKVPSTVLEPFCGSGTTLEVAAKLNRKAIGYEISKEYCQLIVERNNQSVLL